MTFFSVLRTKCRGMANNGNTEKQNRKGHEPRCEHFFKGLVATIEMYSGDEASTDEAELGGLRVPGQPGLQTPLWGWGWYM